MICLSEPAPPIENGVRPYELIKRPQLTYEMLADFDESRPDSV